MNPKMLAAPCLLVLACGGPQVSASVEELRAAVPSPAWISMPLAEVHPLGQSACSSSSASTFGTASHQIAGTVDGVLNDVFGVIQDVTSQPPAARDASQAMWGPIAGASSVYTLAVQRVSATEFNFFLGGEPKGAGDSWQGVFGGNTVVTDPQHRSGEVDINFGVMHSLDPTVDPVAGGAAVRFTINGGEREVTAHFGGIVGRNAPHPEDSDYAFTRAADGTVGFAFATHIDVDHDGTQEVVQIQSRWTTDARGTAHVTVSGGSLGQRTVKAIECWNQTLGRVFYTDDQQMNGREGDSGCCPF